MAKKVSNSTTFENDFLLPIIDRAEKLLSLLNALEKQQKELLNQSAKMMGSKPFKGYEEIQSFEKGVDGLAKAHENLNNIEEQRKKLQEELNKQVQKRKQLNEQLRKRIQQEQKAVKSSNDSLEAYAKTINAAGKSLEDLQVDLDNTKKSLQELNKEEKSGNITTEEASKQRAQLKLQTQILNTEIRKQRKNVIEQSDAYKVLLKQTNEAQAEFKRLAAQYGATSKEATEARKSFENLDDRLREINESARDGRRDVGRYQLALEKVRGTLKLIGATAVIGLIAKLGEVFQSTSTGADTLEKGVGRLTITIREFTLALITSFQNFDSQGLTSFSNAFNGITDRINASVSALDNAVDATRAYRQEAAQIAPILEELNQQQQLLEITSDDATLSLEDQITALKDFENVTRDVGLVNERLAKQELQIAQARFNANKDSIEAFEALKEAERALIEVQGDRLRAEVEISKRRREIISDDLELTLDVLIDGADNQKTINERIIADERANLERRRQILNDTNQLIEDSFAAQIQSLEIDFQLIRNEQANQLDAESKILSERIKLLSKTESERADNAEDIAKLERQITQKAKQASELRTQFKLDENKLINESDFESLSQQIKNTGLSEILQTRLLEIIRERKTGIQDLKEANDDLNDSERDSRDIQSDIVLQAQALQSLQEDRAKFNTILEELEEKRRKQEIENLNSRLELAEEGSQEQLQIQQQLFDKLIEQERIQGEKLIEQRKQIQKAASEVITAFGEKLFEDRLNSLDRELEAVRRRSDELRELAQNDVESATENLAFQQKREAEIERERERVRKQQEKSKLFLSLLDAYSARVAEGDPNALQNTLKDPTILRAFVQSFPSFESGIDLTGRGNIDNKGGFHAILHPDEMVLSKSDRGEMAGSPTTRADVIAGYNLGHAIMHEGMSSVDRVFVNQFDDSRVVHHLQEVKRAIGRIPIPVGVDYDTMSGIIAEKLKSQNKLTKNYKKVVRRH